MSTCYGSQLIFTATANLGFAEKNKPAKNRRVRQQSERVQQWTRFEFHTLNDGWPKKRKAHLLASPSLRNSNYALLRLGHIGYRRGSRGRGRARLAQIRTNLRGTWHLHATVVEFAKDHFARGSLQHRGD